MSFSFSQHHDRFLFVPLGGANEIGMNLNCYHYQGKWLLIDFGIGFADDFLPGVDIVVPDIQFLIERKHDIVGLVLTHAHEDHLGAVPYLWNELGCPIYATPFTTAFLKRKLSEQGISYPGKIHEVTAGSKLELAPFTVDMVGLTHSIPEMQALAIRTDKGVVMHTGDWKFDPAPLVGPASDEIALKRYGDEGVLALVCDSTNVFVEGESGSEESVREELTKLIRECRYRVVVTTFASNIARIETILKAAKEAGRLVVLAGRSLWRITDAAKESGYLQDDDYEFLTDRDAATLKREDTLILCTGCQGEPLAALTKIARNEHPNLRLNPGDTVIFASRKIPGNEKRISWVQNHLTTRGIEIITDGERHVHVSGHPARGELTRMYQLIRPHIAVPVHGEARHIHAQAKLAKALQVPHTIEPKNGIIIDLDRDEPRTLGEVPSGYVAVDGNSLLPTDSPIIKTRRRLRDEGVVIVSLALSRQGGLAAAPAIMAPGVLDQKEDRDLLHAFSEAVADAVEGLKRPDAQEIEQAVRTSLRSLIKRELGKKPMIEVQMLKVA